MWEAEFWLVVCLCFIFVRIIVKKNSKAQQWWCVLTIGTENSLFCVQADSLFWIQYNSGTKSSEPKQRINNLYKIDLDFVFLFCGKCRWIIN